MYGTKDDYLFVIKSLFKQRPGLLIIVAFCMTLPTFAYAL